MATYPTFPQVVGSHLEPVDDLQVDVAVNGSARARAFYPAVKYRLRLQHQLDDSDLATLLAFYGDHRTDPSVDVQWKPECGGPVYACIFDGPPQVSYGNPYSLVTVTLLQV